MGLDIYHQRVVEGDGEKLILSVNGEVEDDNSRTLGKQFEAFVQQGEEQFVNLTKTLENIGLSGERYTISGFGCDSNGGYINITSPDGSCIEVRDEHVISDTLPISYISTRELSYQRGGMKWGWKQAIRDKFDLPMDWAYLTTQEQLDFAKTFCKDGSPMLSWVLSENEYIYFWY